MTLGTRIRRLNLLQCRLGRSNEIEDEWQADGPLEEERLAHYDRTRFLPIRIGQVFLRRYKIVAKLGYGSQATIWLCFDKTTRAYLVFKAVTALPWNSSSLPYERKSREMVAEESPAVVPLDPRKFCLACTSPKSCAPDQFPLWKKHLHARATLV